MLVGRHLAWRLRRPPAPARALAWPAVFSSTRLSSRPSAATATAGAGASRSVRLTPEESNLFDFLLYIQHLYAPRTRLRVAGGWVRDKLRGTESADIDVVLDNMRGKKFAGLITKFQRQRKLPPSSVGIVKANSDKSKHLEVATVTIDGLMVDLVHLRSEEYSNDSRIPSTTFATPEEDASRRDMTINALFYNLHTREIEDFTGRGLGDLDAGVVRTPLEPLKTFMDDPLRVLRAVRFACEFNYTLDPTLASAVLTHEEIKEAMKRKVSRERIGIEVRKMLSGKDPARAFHLLSGFGLLDIVFNDPEALETATDSNSKTFAPREWTKEVAETAHKTLRAVQSSRLALAGHQISFVESSGAILSALFLPSPPQVEASVTSLRPIDQVASMDEEELIQCAIQYVKQRDAITYALPLDELVEMLKTNVKWPRPAAKRAALIVEAVATFPTVSQVADSVDEQAALAVTRFMWMTRYNSVLSPAVSILLSRSRSSDSDSDSISDDDFATHKTLLDLAGLYANSEDNKRRRVDGREVKERLGLQPGPEIARALAVLHVWEALHPARSVDAELEFLERLVPHL